MKECSNSERVKIQNSLYGYTDHSNKGNYKYKRKGIMEKYPFLKLSRGGLIVRDKDKREIVSLLEKNNAKVKLIPINILSSYLKKL
ncbi:MAG: hypothetical protein ACOCUI_02835 [bacterium]